MPSLPWPTGAAELRMFVRPPRASRRPVSGGLPFRGRLFLSVDPTTGAPVIGIRYGAAATNGSASVTYSSNQQQFGQIAAFTITAGTDTWVFNSATLINFGNKYYFLSQNMTINGGAFTVAGIGDVVGSSFGTSMAVVVLGTTVGSLNFSATAVNYLPAGSQPPGVQVTVGSDDSLTWVSDNATFTGFPTLLGVNRNGGPNPLTGGYVGTVTGGPNDEVDWEASGQGPVDDEPVPPAWPVAEE